MTVNVREEVEPGLACSMGGRTSAFAECRNWPDKAVRWSSCAILPNRTGSRLASGGDRSRYLCSSDYRDIIETLKCWGVVRACIRVQ
jgi:hypothetical protein